MTCTSYVSGDRHVAFGASWTDQLDKINQGWRHERIQGEAYSNFVEKFVGLIKKHQPKALLHFEDFGVDNAQALLDTYRDQHPIFNDDVQGTGAVTVSRSSCDVRGVLR